MDEKLLERLRKGDERALAELYNAYWKSLYIAAYNVLQCREVCEDVVQEVFLSVWNRRAVIKIKTSLKNYLYASTRYQVFAQIRKNNKALRSDFFDTIDQRLQYNSPESEIIYKELLQQIDSTVERLPDKCKKVYTLSRNEQLSHLEISDMLEISTKTVENHLTKALRILRTSLGIPVIILLYFLM